MTTDALRRWLDSLPVVKATFSGHWEDCRCADCVRVWAETAKAMTGATINHDNHDVRFMDQCSVDCDLCDVYVTQAVHACGEGNGIGGLLGAYNCVNICRDCVVKIIAAIPSSWKLL